MAKKRKAKKIKAKRKRTAKNKPERQPSQDIGTPPEPNDAFRALYCMDPKLIMDHLAHAEMHVAQGAGHVNRQRELLENLARDGHDTMGSSALLDLFKEIQDVHVQDRDRLRAELADVMKQLPSN